MRRITYTTGLIGLLTAVAGAQVPPPPGQQGRIELKPVQATDYEVLARGPVHEAFAVVVDGKMEPTPVVPKAPPPPVEEMPPDLRPAGEDVEWVGGYWYWVQERGDYVWVSGCWRDAPPGRDWLPGQWVQLANGFHWVSGAWVPEGTTQLTLLPHPPEGVEEAPGPPPTPTRMYVSGVWVWKDDHFAWRPGQWVEQPAEWVWMPAHYIWTPSGFLFIDGYWDHPLAERGFLYAPVVFQTPLVNRRVVYIPSYVIRPNFLYTALFVRNVTKHYYFGDFFEDRYRQAGFVPWYDYRTSRVAIDPIFAHYRAYHRERDWERSLRSLYAARYEGTVARPPRTWSQQQEAVRSVLRDRRPEGDLPPEAARVAPLVNLRQQTNVQQTIQNIQNVTNRQVLRVEDEQKQRFQQAVDRRRQAAEAAQQEQVRRLKEQGNRITAPKQPIEVKVPKLPRTERPVPPKGQPPIQPKGQPPKGQPPTTPPKGKGEPPDKFQPPKGQPQRKDPPPQPKFNPPTLPKGQPPIQPQGHPPKGQPPTQPPKGQPPAKGKGDPPDRGKGDPPGKGKGKSDDRKKDDKKKDKDG